MVPIKRIAVVGAGASGLTSIKACKEENIEPVCFERTDNIGGLWRYRDETINGVASVMKTTVINTSKEMNAFSDFPPPKEFPNFMHNTFMLKYFEMYAEHFDLLQHIKFNQEVVKINATEDYLESGKWIVVTKNLKDGRMTEQIFDGVMICIGHHVYPNMPTFEGLNNFKGRVLHTHCIKKTTGYEDKNVLVIGIGNSGADAAVELSTVANKVYLSTRKGSWIVKRLGPNGVPSDIVVTRRCVNALVQNLPYNLMCWLIERELNSWFDHELYKLKPKHRCLSQHPTMNDSLPNKILSGTITIRGDVKKFCEKGVVFEGEENENVTPIDVVIMATGYRIAFPFLSDDVIPICDNRVNLYKYVFPPHLPHPSLAIIGLVQTWGSVIPMSEMQARWYALLMNNKVNLPSQLDMKEDIKRLEEFNAHRYVSSSRHTIQADFVPYMDDLGSLIGVKPNFLSLLFTDPRLFWISIMGPCVPYQYRLIGPHSWEGAREAILTCYERVKAPLNSCEN